MLPGQVCADSSGGARAGGELRHRRWSALLNDPWSHVGGPRGGVDQEQPLPSADCQRRSSKGGGDVLAATWRCLSAACLVKGAAEVCRSNAAAAALAPAAMRMAGKSDARGGGRPPHSFRRCQALLDSPQHGA
eukprot:1463790-Pyramimonas_sp.AAC.1